MVGDDFQIPRGLSVELQEGDKVAVFVNRHNAAIWHLVMRDGEVLSSNGDILTKKLTCQESREHPSATALRDKKLVKKLWRCRSHRDPYSGLTAQGTFAGVPASYSIRALNTQEKVLLINVSLGSESRESRMTQTINVNKGRPAALQALLEMAWDQGLIHEWIQEGKLGELPWYSDDPGTVIGL